MMIGDKRNYVVFGLGEQSPAAASRFSIKGTRMQEFIKSRTFSELGVTFQHPKAAG